MANFHLRQAVILAGGMGTRLRPLTDSIPKPMVVLNRRPFLEYLIELLKQNGIKEVVLLLGYLHHKIVKHFKDGTNFGINIKYSIGRTAFETGKRIKDAAPLLEDDFLLLYCDNYWPLNLKKLIAFHTQNKTDATVTVYTNKDRISVNNMCVSQRGYVLKYDKSRKSENLNGVEIGFYILNKSILNLMPENNFSFEQVILPKLIEKQQLSGYLTDHRYYSIGSMERIAKTEKYLQPKKVVFLDRDGVINKKAPKARYIRSWSEFSFIPGAIKALTLLTEHGYKIFIITNQAGIARKMMNEQDLETIHHQLLNEALKHHAKIEKIYYCPHGWNDNCNCRKPAPGMFFQAAREYDFDISKALFVGDDQRDLQAGRAAGCKTFLVDDKVSLLKIVSEQILDVNEPQYFKSI